jgi:alpha-glucosidase
MKTMLPTVAALCMQACSVFSSQTTQVQQVSLHSPNGKICAKISVNDTGRLTYVIERDGRSVLLPSPLGVVVGGHDLGTNARLGQPVLSEIDETYPTRGVHSQATNHCESASIPVTGVT